MRSSSASDALARASGTSTSAACGANRATSRAGSSALRSSWPPERTRAQAAGHMEFRRVPSLPPYVFAVTEQLKLELRRAGEDVIDLGFGNPDVASPAAAVDKLAEAA